MNNPKEYWDISLASFGAVVHFGLQAIWPVDLQGWINIGVGASVILLALIRAYFWIKHDGYPAKRKKKL